MAGKKKKNNWLWLLLLILAIIFLIISCNKKTTRQLEQNNSSANTTNSTSTQSIVKLLTFHFTEITRTYTGGKNSLGQLIPEIHPQVMEFGVRGDGEVQIAEISTGKYECDPRPGGQSGPCGVKTYYRVKAMNLSSTELTKLEKLIEAAQDSKWNDIECNSFVSNRDDIQIEFYQQNEPHNQIRICFVSTDHAKEYILPDVPSELNTLVNQLIAIKRNSDKLPWLKSEIQDPFSTEWWY